MIWVGIGIAVLALLPMLIGVGLFGMYFYVCSQFLDNLVRIFREKPLFIIPRGQPLPDAEEVTLRSPDGVLLRGCYIRGEGSRRGVILFGLEFGSSRWSCRQYCESLLQSGYDVFALEPRNQGESQAQPDYEQLQWATDRDLVDMQTAIEYLKNRPDADPRGIGLFGVSKGGCVGMIAAADEPYIRCAVTDGIFGIQTTMVPYMRKWIQIYSDRYLVQGLLPMWFYREIGMSGVRRVEQESKVEFLHIEPALRRFRRPLFMIHGGADTYIKPQMARTLFEIARGDKSFWLVSDAKHNQALHVAGPEYHRRVREFFDQHLAEDSIELESLVREQTASLASH